MGLKIRLSLALLLAAIVVTALVLFIPVTDVPMLNPKGWVGAQQRDLIVYASLLMAIIILPVFLLYAIISLRYRSSRRGTYAPEWNHHVALEIAWWGLPCIIVVFLAIAAWRSSHALDPYKPLASDRKPLTIQVVSLNWKWLFLYPEQGIAAVNLIQIPVGTPIAFEITSDAPMNSFWIPQLGGQIFAMSGMRTKLHLIADQAGSYRGCSANLSGVGFAGMAFKVEARAEEEFLAWVDSVRSSPEQLDFDRYRELVEPSQNSPVATYVLTDPGLFNTIIMQYMEGP